MSNSAAAALLAALCACAGAVVTGDGEQLPLRSAEFAQYAERVFRLQNDVLDRIAFALEAAPDAAALADLEDRVLEACAGLNALAVRRRDDGSMRPLRDARAARAIPECEAAAATATARLAAVQD